MALTPFQRRLCGLLAGHRITSGESYVAGGVALNVVAEARRISRDIDVFHDTETALQSTWDADRRLLEEQGFRVRVLRDRSSFIEAEIADAHDSVRMEWIRDSAFRFFPLVEHEELGLTLHPVDLATNKVLAMVGRLEARDWVDVIASDERIQPLGYLAWAACGKDPGFGPAAILEHAGRSAHYSAPEIAELAFDGDAPDAALLARQWRGMLEEARAVVAALPPDQAGACVLGAEGSLCRAPASALPSLLREGAVVFHTGRIRGAWPQLVDRR